MSFLQSKNNLGDLENISEARDNLGLGTMAYQMHNEINIDNGNAKLSSLRLNASEQIHENFILMASNSYGDVMWKELTIGDWLNKPQYEIPLSGMCNDINFITEEVLNDRLEIACINNQSIKIIEIQRQGKKPQKIGEFILGSKIKKGSIILNV